MLYVMFRPWYSWNIAIACIKHQSINQSIAVCCGFKSRSDQSKVYKIGICCFFSKNAVLGKKGKDWLTQNQDHVSRVEWHVCSMNCCIPEVYKNPTRPVSLWQSRYHHHIMKMQLAAALTQKINCLHIIAEKRIFCSCTKKYYYWHGKNHTFSV